MKKDWRLCWICVVQSAAQRKLTESRVLGNHEHGFNSDGKMPAVDCNRKCVKRRISDSPKLREYDTANGDELGPDAF